MSWQIRRNDSCEIDAPYPLPVLAVRVAADVVNGVDSGSVWPLLGAAALGCTLQYPRADNRSPRAKPPARVTVTPVSCWSTFLTTTGLARARI
jgi:hypothetical protein